MTDRSDAAATLVDRKPPAGPTFAIAFGGGGARGLAHIHAIEALDELGIRPVAISGSSIGALMGAGMAAGMSGKEIRAYASGVLASRAEVASRLWRARPAKFSEMMEGGLRLGQFNAERIIKAFLPAQIPHSFEELQIPLHVTATDYYGHRLAVFKQGDLRSALAASAALPAVFRPVRRDGMTLIDGGIYNPVPFDVLEGAADVLIAIDVVGAPTVRSPKVPSTIEMMFGATQLMMQSIIALKLQNKRPDILLRPAVERFRVLDFLKVDAIMEETASIKDELKRAVEAALEGSAR
ncbi:patatin-like phospholipase family protein [Chelativorans sp. M5D2P16]|uniref:patatin-like phospholipase family protein n=1 Tax=Chelativorans sp. M5D2P16 TaxID=3095678 RepID=UPI002ACAED91|nr:patatin-like phospholipase family protein [Chelativorans sp. M5D2P16]MDZ5700065.1 patatin-like phospholipase family protein [Chelativorans sp. M5D2P16]